MDGRLRLYSGQANPVLAQEIGRELGLLLRKDPIDVPCIARSFNDGEPRVEIPENARDADFYLVQSTHQPGSHFVELATMVNAAKLAEAEKVSAVMPYFGYARQDRKVKPRTAITAQAICVMLEALDVDRIITTDLHAGQIQGMFRRPFVNLEASPVLLRILAKDLGLTRKRKFADLALVSPDDGGFARCREIGKLVDCWNVTAFKKGRDRDGTLQEQGGFILDPSIVRGRACIVVDDLVATAGSIELTTTALRAEGATSILVAVVHPVLSTDWKTGMSAYERLARAPVDRCYFTDTIPFSLERAVWSNSQPFAGPKRDAVRAGEYFHRLHEKTTIVSVARLFAGAIHEIHRHGSVSSLFERTCAEIFS